MKVKELIEKLKNFPQDHEVILCSDSKGKKYSPLLSICESEYKPTTNWFGDVWCREEKEDNFEEFNPNSIVLYPIY